MPSKTYIVRAHARTVHTKPITFVCAKCGEMSTREVYPGNLPKYCLECAPKKKKKLGLQPPEKGSFEPTHNLVDLRSSKTTPVSLEKLDEPGWYWVRTALDWFSGESIIRYHKKKGLESRGVPMENYKLEVLK